MATHHSSTKSFVTPSLRHADPMLRTPHSVRRFWARVQQCVHGRNCRDCCWLWRGARLKNGYASTGYILADGTLERFPHRLAWILWNRRLFPEGTEASHTCRGPRACCNPHHLVAETHQENSARRTRPGNLVETVHGPYEPDLELLERYRQRAASTCSLREGVA